VNAIEIGDIYKTFPGKKGAKVNALKGFSLTVGEGEVFGFLGPNGAGKTTTIKILLGLIKPSAGYARIMGHDAGSPSANRHIGFLAENPAFFDYLTAEEYLFFTAKIFNMRGIELHTKTEETLKLLDLWEARNRPIRSYSKGMVQRLGLAQALIHDPEVYMLDEPMSGLDPIGRALVKKIILDLRAKGRCVFFSTHITADVESVCDRVGILVNGTLQRVEKVDSILTEGIIGYHLQIRSSGDAPQKEIDVSKAELPKVVAEIHASGQEITLIEPKRKNLEAFFLDIVRGT
jgi:ABC-2 type transport system ATP-binding protein